MVQSKPRCSVCEERGGFVCGGCGERTYCSKEHQVLDWKVGHKKSCTRTRSGGVEKSKKKEKKKKRGDVQEEPEDAAPVSKKQRKKEQQVEDAEGAGGGRVNEAAFAARGYCVAREALSPAELDVLRSWAGSCAPDQALRHQYNQPGDPHRYEYLLDVADGERTGGKGVVREVLRRLVSPLCPELEESDSFVVVSEPGSCRQPWHTDSVPVGALQGESWARSLHYIGVLIPLVDFTAESGRTEVSEGSHRPGAAGVPKKLAMCTGDALVLDGRTLHRGLPNRSGGTLRRLCFMTFKLPSIQDGNAAAYGR